MPDEIAQGGQKLEDLVANLSDQERKILVQALRHVQSRLYVKLLLELRVSLFVILAILTAFGIAQAVGIKTAIVDGATSHFVADPGLKQQISSDVTARLQSIKDLDDRAQKLVDQMDTDAAALAETLAKEFAELRTMLQQIRDDVEVKKSKKGKP